MTATRIAASEIARAAGCRLLKGGAILLLAVALSGCSELARFIGVDREVSRRPEEALVPLPTNMADLSGDAFQLRSGVPIRVSDPALVPFAAAQAEAILSTLRLRLPVELGNVADSTGIQVRLVEDGSFPAEAYRLTVTSSGAIIEASSIQGTIWGFQTLRQLAAASANPQRPDILPIRIEDQPAYEWRGAMLDVARHFFRVDEVTAFIDALSYYKVNRLHLHLTDDQGWRLMIRSWPRLATVGGRFEVGGTLGGYFTQAEYREIVEYADLRGVTIVPEIEMPGHIHAAITAYPELACLDRSPEPYFGTLVGFSSLCFDGDIAWRFVEDVIREVSQLTTGPWVHIGADEVYVTPHEVYQDFVPRAESIVNANGKIMVGWEEIAKTEISSDAIVQHWTRREDLNRMVGRPNGVIMSPATRAYLDAKYSSLTPIGQTWIGEFVDVRKSYEWDPREMAPEDVNIIGVEGPLWTESTRTFEEVEYLAFPRMIGLAEIGWVGEGADWNTYVGRLGAQGWYLDRMGINFHRDSSVRWD